MCVLDEPGDLSSVTSASPDIWTTQDCIESESTASAIGGGETQENLSVKSGRWEDAWMELKTRQTQVRSLRSGVAGLGWETGWVI